MLKMLEFEAKQKGRIIHYTTNQQREYSSIKEAGDALKIYEKLHASADKKWEVAINQYIKEERKKEGGAPKGVGLGLEKYFAFLVLAYARSEDCNDLPIQNDLIRETDRLIQAARDYRALRKMNVVD
jgi:hypothetical protein